MVKITVNEVLKAQNKSKYWLIKNTGLTFPTVTKLVNNETISINFDTLEKICNVLNCTPNDIIKII